MKFIDRPYLKKYFKATNLEDLMLFKKAFVLTPEKIKMVQTKLLENLEKRIFPPQEEGALFQIDITFEYLPYFFDYEKALSWKANLQFEVDGTGTYTLKIEDGKCTSVKGAEGTPTCVVRTDMASLVSQLYLIKMEDSREDNELSDSDLEMIAGGKNSIKGCGFDTAVGYGHDDAGCVLDAYNNRGCSDNVCYMNFTPSNKDVGPCVVNLFPEWPII